MKIKQKITIVGIAIIFALFIGYGIEVFDPSPQREDFCPQNVYMLENETACVEAGGEWNNEFVPKSVTEERFGSCIEPLSCYDAFRTAQEPHDKIVFITALIIGILTIIASFQIKQETISAGLLAGSVLLILYGTIRYWQYAANIVKFVLLGIALASIVWYSYKKLQ